MKICFDTEIFGLQKRGGASNYWLEFMSRFIKEDDVEFFCFEEKKYLNKDFVNFMKENRIVTRKDKKFSPSLLRIINPPKIKDKCEIFHSTAYRYQNRKDIKNIVTIHDFTHQKYMNGYHKIANSLLKKRAIKNADGIVCISKSTYNDLLEFYPEATNKPITVIYNGFNDKVFHKMENCQMPMKFSDLINKKYILFVGQRDGYKNFTFILELMKKDKSLMLCLVGGNEIDYDQLNNLDIQKRIFHYNGVNDYELNVLYNNCFCFIYPSLYEGFGIPICEAMNCGCPVIAFNNSSIPEVMNGAGILLANNDLDGVCKALEKLEKKEFRDVIVEEQYKACKKFSWDTAYYQMKDFYKKVMEND